MNSESWNQQVDHPLQAYEWGEFRKATGVKVVREDGMQITIHRIPHTQWNVGYAPKTIKPLDHYTTQTLKKVSSENNCIFIKVEPKEEITPLNQSTIKPLMKSLGFVEGRSLFTKYNFVLDVSPSEAELLASFKQKTRYNIRVAEKKGVTVSIDDSPAAFARYLELTEETTSRQGFYAHGPRYHSTLWSVLGDARRKILDSSEDKYKLSSHLLVAKYEGEIITTWVLFKFKDTLYYPYGASTREHREVMANNLVMWEAIKLAKQWNLKYLDMWGALGPDPDPKDPWHGFHTFKSGYNPRQVEYIGTWDYVANPLLYKIYTVADNLRWKMLRLRK